MAFIINTWRHAQTVSFSSECVHAPANFSSLLATYEEPLGVGSIQAEPLRKYPHHLISLIWKIIFSLLQEPATNAC